ncbi:MAG: hypothetical protein IJ220_01855 [Clostridia bacterium]|nr:hypothetical protein [Clostridia bacterium]
MKYTKVLCLMLVIYALTFVLVACNSKKEPVQEENVTPFEEKSQEEAVKPVEEEQSQQIANPIVEYDTVEDAVIQVGHLCPVPTIYTRYNQKASVINNTLIQIVFSDDEGDILTLREEARPSGDISGNYNSYPYESTFESNGNIITIKGDSEDSIQLITWNDGAYSHSIDYVNGVSLEEVKAAVEEIDY